MDVNVKTKELCEAIIESEEFKDLIRTETILFHDPDAQDLIQEFNQLQTKLQNLYQESKKATSEDFARLRDLEKALNSEPSAVPYLVAQQKFTNLIAKVNSTINETIRIRNTTRGSSCSCGKHTL